MVTFLVGARYQWIFDDLSTLQRATLESGARAAHSYHNENGCRFALVSVFFRKLGFYFVATRLNVEIQQYGRWCAHCLIVSFRKVLGDVFATARGVHNHHAFHVQSFRSLPCSRRDVAGELMDIVFRSHR